MVTAPIAGVLVKVKPHAFVVVAPDGRAVLVHLGIDTVSLGGDGFTVLADEGAPVAIGDPVVRLGSGRRRGRGLSAICPVVALEARGAQHLTRSGARRLVIFTWA